MKDLTDLDGSWELQGRGRLGSGNSSVRAR